MGNTNYISSIVKVLEEPEIKLSTTAETAKMRVQFPQTANENIQSVITLVFHDSSSQLISQYYQPNDFILIEGYLSVEDELQLNSLKDIYITVLKVYPLFSKLDSK